MNRKKIFVFILAAVFMSNLSVFGASVYTCGFEENEQINVWGDHIGEPAFVFGSILDQGDPAWYGTYFGGNDVAGDVVPNDPESGFQCMQLTGYRTSDNTLNSPTIAPWFEFAFKPMFGDSDPLAIVWMKTTRGAYYDVVGLNMVLTAGTGKIVVNDVKIGDFINGQWQTISFRHRISEDGLNYSGAVDVFLGAKYVNTVYPGSANHSLRSIIFSSAEVSWVHNGQWFIDSINIGDEPVLAIAPLQCGDRNTVYLDGDISGPLGVPDCYLDFYDLQLLADQWLK